ncbi:hypothetical protein P3S67_002003 [Capsicum chacoense]
MNFIKILAVTSFLIMIFVANSNVNGKINLSCAAKCAKTCFFRPSCAKPCFKECLHCEEFNCKFACSMDHRSKFKEDNELLENCWNECSTEDHT